jgi:signal transduction histidine kinase/CheY-like chemotaxis protein
MAISESTATPSWSYELESVHKQLQDEVILLTLPGLGIASLVLVSGLSRADDPSKVLSPAIALWFLALIVGLVRRWTYVGAALTLVLGCAAVDLWIVRWAGFETALYLLALPFGLATVLLSRAIGAGLAVLCTLALAFAPPSVLPAAPTVRTTVAVAIWGVVGLVWLTLRPLLTVVRYAWASYEQSHTLLEQARDYQQRLRETLDDLADANTQLARLHQQAQALRLVAEEERRAKERFVANVSHELRTPLNLIIGFCEMITQSPKAYGRDIPPALLADLTVVLRNSQHLSSLVDDVLDLSQVEAGQMALIKERVALAEVIEAAATAVRPLFEAKELYLEIDVPAALPEVLCDRTRIREVVLNLLSNAGRFTERGGVRVRAWQEGNSVVVSVADTGPGISEENRGKLFQPFHQLDQAVQRRFGGTGLGLSISREFVELHGGKMWVESELGQGATFYFRLPTDPPLPLPSDVPSRLIPGWEYQRRTRRSRAPIPALRPRWVVVENGSALQRLLNRYLDEAEIIPAADLETAMIILAETPTQALLVNAINIEETLRQINKATLPYEPLVLICSVPDIEQSAESLGVADYLLKPISRDALLGALERLGKDRHVATILVVDDEPDARQLFRRMLTSAGRDYRVLRAADGRQALSILRREQVDAILLDLVMPNMDGFQLLAAIRQQPSLREIPVIVISARDPQGQPIVSNALVVTRPGGLSVAQLVASIRAVSAVLRR